MNAQEKQEVIRKALEAQAFLAQPFWKDWIQYAESVADGRCRELKQANFADDRIKAGLRDRWVITEEILQLMQAYPLSCIEAGKTIAEAPVDE